MAIRGSAAGEAGPCGTRRSTLWGRVVSSPFGRVVEEPEPGMDVELNLDLDLTEWIHHIFPDSMRGAVIALDVEDGGVLALYSASDL